MSSLKERAKLKLDLARRQSPLLDHAIGTQEHYTAVKGSMQAGAVTYFAFLSFFPILALAFFVVGYVAKVYPDAQADLLTAIDSVLPNMVGDGQGQIPLDSIRNKASTVGLIGLAGVLYSGLGWLSGMRTALLTVFEKPEDEQPNFVMGKLRDLLTLAVIGLTLVLSVGVSGLVTGFSAQLLEWLNLDDGLSPLLRLIGLAVGVAANVVLFYALFRLLAAPDLSTKALLSGALLGAIGFEVLKFLSNLLLSMTEGQPAFQAFGIALILLVWINYFSRVVMYAAAWARTPRGITGGAHALPR